MRNLLERIVIFLSGNVAAQGLSAIAGLLVARWLSVEDYALYTIVFLLMGAISVLTKGGIHLGFTAILGRTWPDMQRASEAVSAALQSRRLLSLLVLPPLLTISAWLLLKNGASATVTTGLLILLIAFWWSDMRTRVIDQILMFAKQTSRIQALDAALAIVRLIVVLALYMINWLNLNTVVILAVLIAFLRIHPVLSWIGKLLPTKKNISRAEDLKEIRTCVRRQFPSDLFHVFQVQIAILMITVYGTSADIAGYGALLRFQQLMLPVQAVIYAFAVPYFAKKKERLLSTYAMLVLLSLIPGIALITAAWIAPSWLLMLVGENYATLTDELLRSCMVTAFVNTATVAWMLVSNRGWLKWSWVQIPLGILWCAVAPKFLLDMGKLEDAVLLQAGFGGALLISAIICLYSATRHYNSEQEKNYSHD